MDQQFGNFDVDVPQQRSGSNVLGVVGFILAFCLSPIGLLLSLIALAKPPRGFAIGGVVVGLLGSVVWALIGFGVWVGGPAAMQFGELMMDYETIDRSITNYEQANNGMPPPSLAALNLPANALTDPWGTPYRYTVTADGSWTLESAGPDGDFDKGITAVFTPDMTQKEFEEQIEPVLEEALQQRFNN